MKATELRLGNAIEKLYDERVLGGQLYWSSGLVNITDIHGITDFPDIYRPIKLTLDWIEKLNFKLGREDNAYSHNETGFPIWYNDESNSFYHINSESLVHIDHVHQLQNLFFALTGEELPYDGW